MDEFLLSTDYNNQKILLNHQETLLPTLGGFEYSYDHNLGYIPSARIWYEAAAGKWYPLGIRLYDDGVSGGYLRLIGSYNLTTTNLFVEIRDVDGLETQCNILVRLYLDD